ncbi:MAG: glutamyl-tRNA reductase [Burkholderiaceae bacterium]
MSVIALGLNHTTAPLDVRGRFAFPGDRLVPTLQAFRSRLKRAPEVAIVSTCNRTELYVGSDGGNIEALTDDALGWLAESGGMEPHALRRHFYVLEDAGAARHTFRLASGLSSMVVGETQILGQMKQAVREADSAGTLGSTLHQLFQRSFAVAKEVRSGTEIGMHSVSLASAIVRQATQLFEDFTQLNVLFIGAGEMAGPVLAHIAARQPKRLTIANRSLARGEALAAHFHADAIGLASVASSLADYDVVVSCTASPLPVIGLGAVERAIKARRRRPMLMVDLAVPRDIEAEVAQLGDVYLYTIDDLSHIVQAGSDKRQAAVGQAETIIETGVQEFVRWLQTRETVPLIQALQSQAEAWRGAELQRARKLLAKGGDLDDVLESLSRGLTQKMLHGPMAGLHALEGEERVALTATLSRLFLQCPQRPRR